MKIRVKFGKNPYGNDFTCAACRRSFSTGGFFLRLECRGNVVDIPVCRGCYDAGDLF